jgi:hypothetical protein
MNDDDDAGSGPIDEAAALRRSRFGELPARVPPENWVEEVETDLPAHELEQSMPIVQHPGRVEER